MSETLAILHGPIEADDDFNLTVVRYGGAVLMGRKTRGYGEGKLVLPGGKTRFYIGASGMGILPFASEAAREATEETGLAVSANQMRPMGVLHVADEDTRIVRLYEARLAIRPSDVKSGELEDIDWIDESELQYDHMPDDYRLWLPHVLAGYAVTAFFESDGHQVVEGQVFRQRLDPLGRAELLEVQL